MCAVMAEVPADFLHERRQRGADIWDEMWEGVLHMPPAPNIEHQDFEYQLAIEMAGNPASLRFLPERS